MSRTAETGSVTVIAYACPKDIGTQDAYEGYAAELHRDPRGRDLQARRRPLRQPGRDDRRR